MPNLKEKNWSKELEKPICEKWKKERVYRFDPKSKKPVFSIDTPPPYVNTPIHTGHATTYVIMDMFARFKRMTGFNVLFPLGLDRNGLPIEIAAEKKFGVSLKDVPREKFIAMCLEILKDSSIASMDSFLRLGISFNSWEVDDDIGSAYLTDSKKYRTLTQSTFIDMWNKGLIYEDERINNYCPGCMTTLADDEIEYKELSTLFNNIIFKVKETGEDLVIATTRPELICTCGMVIFNPDDQRYKHLRGKKAVTPLYNKEVPIMPHTMADPEKGTGLAMMCSAGDQSDIRFFREMGLQAVIAIDADGRMNKNAGFLKGLKIEDARKRIIEMLKEKGLLVSQTKMMHRTPVCERSKHSIEFISMPELYLKQLDFKEKMRDIAKKLNFYAPESRQILLDWIDAVSIDWAISRRRYYATEIPLWYCKSCGKTIVPEKGKYYQPWREPPPSSLTPDGRRVPLKCPECGGTEFRGEERVLDTWFDSSISALYIMSYPTEFFDSHSPCTLRPQGKEIIRNWLYYTLLRCWLLTGKQIFRDVWINYHIVDEKGKKMSKSLGNIIDPKDVLDRYGAEPFRFWSAIEGNLEKTDFRCSFERIGGVGKTLTKLWNIAKFVSMFKKTNKEVDLTETDKWVIHEMNTLVKNAKSDYEKYDFHNPAVMIKHFIWETFASHYIELVKNRAYNHNKKFSDDEQESAVYTLNYCLDTLMKILAPVLPMFTYKIYMEMRNKDIHLEKFPEIEKDYNIDFTTEELTELNSAIWKAKKENNLSLKAEITKLTIPKKFSTIENDLKFCHNIKEIDYGDKIEISL